MSLSTKEKTHLINVYAGLGGCFTLSAAGIYAGFMGAWTGIATLSSFILMIWLALTPPPAKPELRLKLLFALSFSLGLASYPLVEGLGQGMVFSALSTTAICFFTFTLWALFSDRQVFVFLGAWLSLGLSSLYWLRFFQAFFPLKGTHALELYLGLLVFSGYVIYDTQLILARVKNNTHDVAHDCLTLFLDFYNLFMRILRILRENDSKKQQRRRRS